MHFVDVESHRLLVAERTAVEVELLSFDETFGSDELGAEVFDEDLVGADDVGVTSFGIDNDMVKQFFYLFL